MSTLILLLLVTALSGWLYLRRRRYWSSRLSKNVFRPGIAFPIIGHVYKILYAPNGYLAKLLQLGRKYEVDKNLNQVFLWVGEIPLVGISRAEDVEILLGNTRALFKPNLAYGPARAFFGNGLITLNGEAWQHHRKVLTPVFHFRILERYAEVFDRRAGALVKELLDPKVKGTEIDVMRYTSRTVLHTISETAFGMSGRFDTTDELQSRKEFVEAAESCFLIIRERVVKPWLMVDWLFRLTPLYKKQKKAERIMTNYALKIIRMKKEEIASEHENGKIAGDDTGVKKKVAFLDLVLREATDLLSEDEIVQEVRTLVTVQQTTATTLAFIFVMLAIHQDVQERVYREIVEQDKYATGRSVYERLGELKYLERVIKETIRLYPVTSLFGRGLKEDLAFPKDTFPAGLHVAVFVFFTHRDPRFYGPDPEKFDPDHFLPERCRTRHPYAYIPFSAGPRNCIGQKYAMVQLKAVVSTVVRNLKIFPGKGCRSQKELRLDIDTFLHIKDGFNVRFEPRE